MINWLMNQEEAVVAALFLSIVSLCISLLTVYINKKTIITKTISIQRIQRIKDVRELLFEFIKEYTTSNNKMKLYYIRCKIALYMRKGLNSYKGLINILDKCIQIKKPHKILCEKLIEAAQIVLKDEWDRMKREAMISKKQDKKMDDEHNKRYNERYK